MNIRISHTATGSYTDGPGPRFSIYVQGCSVRCTGCQSPNLWDPAAGHAVDVGALADEAAASGLPVTLIGGEPLDQPEAVAILMAALKLERIHVVIYSGRTFEELLARSKRQPAILRALGLADVLVDGPYRPDLDDAFVQYRGSRNQRAIDLQATFNMAARDYALNGPALLDWGAPEVTITEGGDILAAEGLIDQFFAPVGAERPASRCGLNGGTK
jgi:anaerobic ribonucleoside-triphosphate reductase activating protein